MVTNAGVRGDRTIISPFIFINEAILSSDLT
jgi:hypothetical protein